MYNHRNKQVYTISEMYLSRRHVPSHLSTQSFAYADAVQDQADGSAVSDVQLFLDGNKGYIHGGTAYPSKVGVNAPDGTKLMPYIRVCVRSAKTGWLLTPMGWRCETVIKCTPVSNRQSVRKSSRQLQPVLSLRHHFCTNNNVVSDNRRVHNRSL